MSLDGGAGWSDKKKNRGGAEAAAPATVARRRGGLGGERVLGEWTQGVWASIYVPAAPQMVDGRPRSRLLQLRWRRCSEAIYCLGPPRPISPVFELNGSAVGWFGMASSEGLAQFIGGLEDSVAVAAEQKQSEQCANG